MDRLSLNILMFFLFATPDINAQQQYSGNSVMNCHESDKTGPSPAFLYTCNGKRRPCKAFLIYKSQPPYNTLSSIANLTSSDPFKLSRINNISSFVILPTGKEVIVPVVCSCSGQYYQANASYTVPSIDDTCFTIANNTYEGLSTCNSLLRENSVGEFGLDIGMELRVPLRCACPTSNQTANGTRYLLTYLVSWGDEVSNVSERFNASIRSVAYANGISGYNPTIFPFTTILIPLSAEPSSSRTIIHYPPTPNPSPLVPTHEVQISRKNFNVWIAVGTSLLFLSLVLSLVLLLYKKKLDLGAMKGGKGKKKTVLPEGFLDRVAKVDQGLKIYEFEELKLATDDFSPDNRLSDCVYRGFIGGQVLAIKRMNKDVSREVNLLRKINHFNLIRLCAACENQREFYLIYEFMDNGSLRDWLRKRGSPEVWSWYRRIQIALDVANGLQYLHNYTDPTCVHKDITSSNVLLDRHLRAKISNFSLARSMEAEEYVSSSMRLAVGAKGYMAPEYIEYGLVTPEIDIYAFGVVLLELITGKEAVYIQNGTEVYLSEATVAIMEGEDKELQLSSLIDPLLNVEHIMELVLRIIKLSLACLELEPQSRPSMAEIVSSLLKIQVEVHRAESLYGGWV